MSHARHLALASVLLLATSPVFAATEVLSRDYGFTGVDDTAAFEDALNDSPADTLVVDARATPWIIGPVRVRERDGLVIVFEPGCRVLAKAGAFPQPTETSGFVERSMLQFIACADIEIVGYGAELEMRKEEYRSQFTHALQLSGVTNFTVRGLTLRRSGGDGVLITQTCCGLPQAPCRNVTLRDCWMDDNRRQGVSVIDVEGLLIEGCRMSNTAGELPQSGIDFEPFRPEHVLKDCVVRRCLIDGNAGRGLQLGFGDLEDESADVDILIEDCHITDNGRAPLRGLDGDNDPTTLRGGAITMNSNSPGLGGTVTLRRVLVERDTLGGFRARKPAGLRVVFEDVVWRDVGNIFDPSATFGGEPDGTIRFAYPITFERVGYPGQATAFEPFGGASFTRCVLEDDRDRPALFAIGYFGNDETRYTTFEDITGDLTVVNPALTGDAAFLGPAAFRQNVTLALDTRAAWPAAAARLEVTDATAAEPDAPGVPAADLGAFRIVVDAPPPAPGSADAASALSTPAYYTLDGEAANRQDFGGLPGALVVPADVAGVDVTVAPVFDGIAEGTERLEIALVGGPAPAPYAIEAPGGGVVEIGRSAPVALSDLRIRVEGEGCAAEVAFGLAPDPIDAGGALALEGSTDGGTWRTLAEADALLGGVYAVAAGPERLFRLRRVLPDGRVERTPAVAAGEGCGATGVAFAGWVPGAARVLLPEGATGQLVLRDVSGRVLGRWRALPGLRRYAVAAVPAGVYVWSYGGRSVLGVR